MRRQAGDSGAAAVEVAVALPIAVAAIGLTLLAGWLALARVAVDRGAAAAARFASIPSSPDLRTWPDEAAILEHVERETPLVNPTDVRLESVAGGRNGQVAVVVAYRVANPVVALLAPLRAVGAPVDPPAAISVTARREVRRE